ncbi:hypothetical protein JRQ81_010611, partial [Phrynocephalus forsythii]
RHLHWLGHVRMDDGRIPEDLLYGELAQGPEGLGNGPQQIGNPDLRSHCLEAKHTAWST